MNLESLRTYCKKMIDVYPEKADQIRDAYTLALDEIEGGGSESHECELAWSDIEEIVKE